MDIKAFQKYLSTAEDDSPVDLKKHDARFHPKGFNPETDTCKLRETLNKGDNSDAALAEAENAEKSDMTAKKAAALKSDAKAVGEAFAAMAKLAGKNALALDGLDAVPSERWNPKTNEMELTGDIRVNAGVKASAAEAGALLDAIADKIGISRKPGDIVDGGDFCRISTFATGDEVAAMKDNLAKMKEEAVKKAAKAKEDAELKAKSEKAMTALTMAAYAIADAAKSVNFHVEQGDFAPNPIKVEGAMAAKKDIENLVAGGLTGEAKDTAEKLLKSCGEIEDSVYKGTHGKVSHVEVPKHGKKPETKIEAKEPKQGKPAEGGASLPAGVGDIYKGMVEGAKTINHHIKAGDFKPNMSRIAAFANAAKALHGLCPNGKSDNPYLQHLCDRAAEIAKSMKNGFKDSIGMIDPPPDAPKSTSKKQGSVQKPMAGEAADAYDYDPGRWAHMAVEDDGPNAMRKAAESMSFDEAKNYLAGLGISVCSNGGDWKNKKHALECGSKHSQMYGKNPKVFEDSVRCAAAAIQDLTKRFPKLAKCHLANIFPSKAKSFGTAAEWIKDHADPDGSTIAFHADFDHIPHGLGYSYSHQDARYPFDVFRHEYMHGISTGAVADKWKAFVSENYGYPAKGFFKLMHDKVSDYAASGDIYESQAEIFAKMTSHDYKPGTLPRKIEDFFYGEVMGAEPASAAHMMYSPEQIKGLKSGGNAEHKQESKGDAPVSADDILSWFSSPKTEESPKAPAAVQKAHAPALAFA